MASEGNYYNQQRRKQMSIKNFGMKSIHSFLNDGPYYIPDYQREYSWDKSDQLEDFWQDLNSTLGNERTHFFGQVVIHEAEDGKYYIIDGQQRTCTSVIMLSVLRDKFALYAENNEYAQYNKEDIRSMYIGRWTPKKNELKLRIGIADREYFMENIQKARPSSVPKSISQKRIKEAYEFLDSKLSDILEQVDDEEEKVNILCEYYETLTKKFILMAITTDDMNEAFIIFETLNARGKELETSDLLKNYVFMKSESNIENIKKKWMEMSEALNNKEDTTKLIRYYWNAGHDFVREKSLYKKVSNEITTTKKCDEVVSDLIKMAELYNCLTSPEDNKYFDDNGIMGNLVDLSIMKTATFYPIIMAMVLKKYADDDINKVVKAIQVLAFRNFVVAGLTANRYEVIFAKIAKEISEKNISSEKIVSSITENTEDDDKFRRRLIGFEVKSVGVAKFILRKIEDYKSSEKTTSTNNKVINLEHIMPKNTNLWNVSEDEKRKNLYRLANQTLLLEEYNKSISNKPFNDKKIMYKKSEIKITSELCDYGTWDAAAIQDREDKLNDIILKIWALQ